MKKFAVLALLLGLSVSLGWSLLTPALPAAQNGSFQTSDIVAIREEADSSYKAPYVSGAVRRVELKAARMG